MSIFGRRDDARPRSAQEREQARREREARRAAREGRPAPPLPPEEPTWAPRPESVEFDVPGPPEVDVAASSPVEETPEPDHVPEPEVVADAPELDADADLPVGEPAPAEAEPIASDADPPVGEPAPAEAEPIASDADPGRSDADASPDDSVGQAEWVGDDDLAWRAPDHETAQARERERWQSRVAGEDEPAIDEELAAAGTQGRPTLDEELAAVDRGWFDGEDEEPGQETVEWDVLANRSRTRQQPPTGPAGVDTPTVEWDVMAEQPKPPVSEHASRFSRGTSAVAEHEDEAQGDAVSSPAVSASAPRPAGVAAQRSRFGDDDERPVPTRRVPRSDRRLPPPPPAPGERRPRGRRPGRRTFVLLGLLVLLTGAAYVLISLFQPLAGEGGEPVRVDVPQNTTAGDIGDLLAERGIVDSATFFTIRARLDGASLKAGEYELRRDMSYGDALKTLAAGPPPPKTIRVTIPEGRARRETAPLIRDAGLDGSYLAATERSDGFNPRRYGAPRNATSLEGFLFPATYELEPGSSSRQLVRQQLAAFRDNVAKVSMNRARRRNLTTYDVLIIASMVEREATLDRERRAIAAVIHNRLREGMPLGIDATIRFATRNWSEPLKQSELAIDSPYNTRRRTGLPPGPIGSPGLASIKAAADPANVKHLFYVVKPCGKGAHNFSSTDAEFQRDVAAYNQKREELGGKSPVDC